MFVCLPLALGTFAGLNVCLVLISMEVIQARLLSERGGFYVWGALSFFILADILILRVYQSFQLLFAEPFDGSEAWENTEEVNLFLGVLTHLYVPLVQWAAHHS